MRRTIVLSVTAAALAWTATAALAAPPQLKGQYAVTGTTGCLFSSTGFLPQTFTPVLPGAETYSLSSAVEGIRVFNGDGTGTAKVTEVGIIPPPPIPGLAGPSAEAATITYSFTYTVNDDGTFSTQLAPGTYVGRFIQGPRTGQTFTVDKLDLTGLLTNENKVLTLATVQAEVETVTYQGTDNRTRVCHRSRTLSWIGE
jgi:hypothetical protein